MIRRLLILALALGACASPSPRTSRAPQAAPGTRTAVLMAINDVYRIEGLEEGRVAGLARVRSLRKELEKDHPDLLLLHGGDFLFPSFASRMYNGKQMVAVLNDLDGNPNGPEAVDDRMFVALGNHEFEKRKDASVLDDRIGESRFHWLGGNVTFKTGEDSKPLVEDRNLSRTALVESGGIRIGIFGLTIPTDGVQYADFAGPEATAKELTAALRAQGAEVVVALTHLNFSDDQELLKDLGDDGPDLIVGGHDHEKMVIQVGPGGKRLVLKADADARTASVIRLTVRNGQLGVDHEFRTLEGVDPRPDPDTLSLVGDWQAKHEQEFCAGKGDQPGCLGTYYGTTRTLLEAEETKIRRQETSLGDWVADLMKKEMEPCGAQVAFINSGTLRLNQDLPAGTKIIRRHVEELFGYDTPLRLIRINGAILQQVAEQSLRAWPGSGSWLQISGFAWSHDTQKQTATGLTLLTPQGPRPVRPDEEILAAVNNYLVDPNEGDQDGYIMLQPSQVVGSCAADGHDLKKVVETALRAANPQGIAPKTEGRICQGQSPCLAQAKPEAPAARPD
jgi:2',3'-cyclic-nucleotide 2'-phosphodiesterase (5'-nucleotidase family)